jgi:hypothetical protein
VKTAAKFVPASDAARQTEAAKTSKLRALRLAKEAADKETAAQEAAAKPAKSPRRRVRPSPMPASSEPT